MKQKNSQKKILKKKFSKKILPKNHLKKLKDFEHIQFPTSHLEAENPFGLVSTAINN